MTRFVAEFRLRGNEAESVRESKVSDVERVLLKMLRIVMRMDQFCGFKRTAPTESQNTL